MKERLMISPEVCTGCRACEITCSFAKERAFWPQAARIAVIKMEAEGYDRPLVCRQCVKPACAGACPTGALARDDDSGLLRLDEDLCVGCAVCVEACPFGAMRMHPERDMPLFCDTCDGDPACVKRCTTKALFWGTTADYAARAGQQRELHRKRWQGMGGEEA